MNTYLIIYDKFYNEAKIYIVDADSYKEALKQWIDAHGYSKSVLVRGLDTYDETDIKEMIAFANAIVTEEEIFAVIQAEELKNFLEVDNENK